MGDAGTGSNSTTATDTAAQADDGVLGDDCAWFGKATQCEDPGHGCTAGLPCVGLNGELEPQRCAQRCEEPGNACPSGFVFKTKRESLCTLHVQVAATIVAGESLVITEPSVKSQTDIEAALDALP